MYGVRILRTTETAVAQITALDTQRGIINTHKIAEEAGACAEGDIRMFIKGKMLFLDPWLTQPAGTHASENKVSTNWNGVVF
jgi:hypothetical protein